MSLRPFAVLSLILALAAPSWAQEQRGTLEGVVRDSSGLVLPGATVEAKNDMTTVVVTSVSDEQGVFRFPSVPPGTYTITVSLQGFQARTASDVRVGLGQVKKVDFSMPLSGVTESVQVTAETPLVDVRSTSRQANIRAEQVELLPKGRDFTTLVTQAPGANQENKLGGLSIDGAASLGVVYQPTTEKLYYAASGTGAFLIENRASRLLQVSHESNPAAMTIALSRSHHSPDIDVIQHQLGIHNTICSGSMGLKVGLICEGRAHVYVHTSRHTSQWDTCAPDVILREAGGRMTDLFNAPLQYNSPEARNLQGVIASNGVIHDRIAEAAQAALTGKL